jgi:hypothetical protein
MGVVTHTKYEGTNLSNMRATGNVSEGEFGSHADMFHHTASYDAKGANYSEQSQQRVLGGPIMGKGDGVWNRDAIVAERIGFDCSKGHPAMGNYHHHQNPSAFKLDKKVIYDVCSLYDAEGLYAINPAVHSPLIGFAYDGFPV